MFTSQDLDNFENSAGMHIHNARSVFENSIDLYEGDVSLCLFSIEQCIETCLKSLILAYGYQPARDKELLTHDIGILIGIYTVEIDGELTIPDYIIDNHSQITSWAVEPRYYPTSFDVQDLAVLIEDTEDFYNDVYQFLEGF